MTTSNSVNQLALSITPRLPYKSTNFIVHQGVEKITQSVLQLCREEKYQQVFIEGAKSSGKTHLSVFLADQLNALGLYPRIIDGIEFLDTANSMPGLLDIQSDTTRSVFILDSAETYFTAVRPEDEGRFVTFTENLRSAKFPLIILSSLPIESFNCDTHIMSRLRSSISFQIQNPSEEEMPRLIDAMIKQRGLKLSDKKLKFLTARLPRSILELEKYLERLTTMLSISSKKADFTTLGDAI